MKRILPLAVAAAAAMLLPDAARAQAQIIRTQLDSAVVLMRSEGFAPYGQQRTSGSLGQGGDASVEMTLQPGTYMLMGVCDGGCSDLDLVLSTGGSEAEADREMDDVPMVMVQVTRPTAYVLNVQMATCSGTCEYGLAFFRK